MSPGSDEWDVPPEEGALTNGNTFEGGPDPEEVVVRRTLEFLRQHPELFPGKGKDLEDAVRHAVREELPNFGFKLVDGKWRRKPGSEGGTAGSPAWLPVKPRGPRQGKDAKARPDAG